MNRLKLGLKEEGKELVSVWEKESEDDVANNELFEVAWKQYEHEMVEQDPKNEPLVTLKLEPVNENTDVASYTRDFSVKAEKQEELKRLLQKQA
ncbi:hypothetical protein [Shouchella shacheensis]|uniref:hypothetical protein n=1 Tax=Shouchella shacheensis TaxID=1649580 RepID=UPI0007403D83|nr:hypothetical protein [Shouchella shacheensis]